MAYSCARDHFTFGAGRRICPGSRFAENALLLDLASMVWTFEVKPPPMVFEGKEKYGDLEMSLSDDALDEAPVKSAGPFGAVFSPRSEARLHTIKEKSLA